MNTRSFLKSMLTLGVGAAILPSAITYSRRWNKPSGSDQLWKPNPDYVTAEYEFSFIMDSNAFEPFVNCGSWELPISPTKIITKELLSVGELKTVWRQSAFPIKPV